MLCSTTTALNTLPSIVGFTQKWVLLGRAYSSGVAAQRTCMLGARTSCILSASQPKWIFSGSRSDYFIHADVSTCVNWPEEDPDWRDRLCILIRRSPPISFLSWQEHSHLRGLYECRLFTDQKEATAGMCLTTDWRRTRQQACLHAIKNLAQDYFFAKFERQTHKCCFEVSPGSTGCSTAFLKV